MRTMKNLSKATAIATLPVAAVAAAAGTASAAPNQEPGRIATSATLFANNFAAVAETDVVDGMPASAPIAPSDFDRSAAIDGEVGATLGAFNDATNDSTLIAGGVGAAVGCAIGAVTGGTLTVLTTAGVLAPIGVVDGQVSVTDAARQAGPRSSAGRGGRHGRCGAHLLRTCRARCGR